MLHPEKNQPRFDLLSNPEATLLWQKLGLLDAQAEVLEAAENWSWKPDQVAYHSQAGISVASALYGEHLKSPTEIHQGAVKTMQKVGFRGEVENITGTSGFSELLQMSTGLSQEAYRISEALAAKELIGNALAVQNIDPSEVDLFIAATSIPVHAKFHQDWMTAANIPLEVPVVRFCMACNSSGRAMAEVLTGVFDKTIAQHNPAFTAGQPATIVLFALDDANRLSDRGGDPLSPQLFSTGGGAVVFRYSPTGPSSLRVLAHTSESIAKGAEYLKAARPYDNWPEEDRAGLYTAQYLQAPPHDGPIEMRPRASIFFINYGAQIAKHTLAKYFTTGKQVTDIKKVIIHHPSKAVFDGLLSKVADEGFSPDQIQWVINEGNVPVATIPIAFGRQLEDLEAGDDILFLSFGAGGEYTCFIAQLGQVADQQSVTT